MYDSTTPMLLMQELKRELGPSYEVSLYPDPNIPTDFWLVARKGGRIYQVRIRERILSIPPSEVPGLAQTVADDMRTNLA